MQVPSPGNIKHPDQGPADGAAGPQVGDERHQEAAERHRAAVGVAGDLAGGGADAAAAVGALQAARLQEAGGGRAAEEELALVTRVGAETELRRQIYR